MNDKKKRICTMLLLMLIIGGIIYAVSGGSEKGTYMAYEQFYKAVESREIESAVIDKDCVTFYKTGEETLYVTDNPEYEGFKELLLLSGVQVTNRMAEEDAFTKAVDTVFTVILLAAVWVISSRAVKSYQNTFKVVRHTGVRFENIAGMHELKKEMTYAVDILKNPQKYMQKGIRPAKGIVLEGPPGNGKTLFAKALAEEAGVNFIATKGADFQSALMSLGPAKIKQLFKRARKCRPCIVFIDEFDGIGEKRNYAGSGIDKENNRIITAMLNEMDGFEGGNGVMVVAATNSYKALDEALIRPGRFDLKYTVGNPDEQTRRELVEMYTKGKQLSGDVTKQWLVDCFQGMSCSAIEAILNEAAVDCNRLGQTAIEQKNIKEACEKMNL